MLATWNLQEPWFCRRCPKQQWDFLLFFCFVYFFLLFSFFVFILFCQVVSTKKTSYWLQQLRLLLWHAVIDIATVCVCIYVPVCLSVCLSVPQCVWVCVLSWAGVQVSGSHVLLMRHNSNTTTWYIKINTRTLTQLIT